MVSSSKAAETSREMKRLEEGEHGKEGIQTLPWRLTQLKKQIQASRLASIKGKLAKNGKNLEVHTSQLFELARSKRDPCTLDQTDSKNMLSHRIGSALCKFRGSDSGFGEKEALNSQEELLSSGIVFGHNGNGKSLIRLIKLPFVEKIPPYTTWNFLDRNQRMAEDQSVVGRRQIYYDQYGSETIICSDSEEEFAEPEEEKHEFSEGEDQILWKALNENGLNQEVLNILSQFIDATFSEIKERYETLLDKYQGNLARSPESSGEIEPARRSFLNKTLNIALDSFDNLFCRRCLIFDCRLHGCSQTLIIPSEKLSFSLEPNESRKPCSDQCYLNRRDVQDLHHDMSDTGVMLEVEPVNLTGKIVTPPSEAEDSDPDLLSKNVGKRKVLKHESMPGGVAKASAGKLLVYADKKQKKLSVSNICSVVSEGLLNMDLISITDTKGPNPDSKVLPEDQSKKKGVSGLIRNHSKKDNCHDSTGLDANSGNVMKDEANATSEAPVAKNSSSHSKDQSSHSWNPIEKDLYLKGVEIFGKNSCLIARNLLSGLKSCMEVANYMFNDGAAMLNRPVLTSACLDDNVADSDYMELEMPTRTRIWRRRGRARKLKYTWKSAGHPSIRKRIADGKEQSCKQYVPCGCKQMCGKKCPCLHNGTCCEKYCGCSKSCKNRFRGCHCAKSQCRSRQCPCFAAGRECDPDVCRNCWVSCGDGSLGEPPGRGDGYHCGNMKLLLKQQQRILLGKSDVAGWGAFIKNPVNKNDYLGEYTGELISHKEADKRGKIYDRANSSFLFDLNDQFVLDAYRKGDKLKFANHSSNPNCYAKVMLVAGDHRVGIFSKEHIEASEELFYDYRYGPDQAPAWARKPEGSKRDDSSVSHGRAQKIA